MVLALQFTPADLSKESFVSKFALLFSILIASGIAEAHPLEAAIRHLSQVAVDLDQSRSSETNSDIQKEIVRIQTKVANAWDQAFRLPLATSDARLSTLGYSLVQDKLVKSYQLQSNDNAAQLEQDAYALKPDRWAELNRIADQQTKDIRSIEALLGDPGVVNGIPQDIVEDVTDYANPTRISVALVEIQRTAQTALACIQTFGRLLPEAGLVPAQPSPGVYTWSVEDLQRVYHVNKLSELSVDDRRKVSATLIGFRDQARRFAYSCIPVAEVVFFENQAKSLQGTAQ